MKRSRTLGVLFTIAGTSAATPGLAQVSVAANAGVFSAYIWRGVTYTNNVVIQPDIALTLPVRHLTVTAGLWANIELGRYDGFSDISESGGTARFNVAEIDWMGEVGVPASSRLMVALGATGYAYPNADGLTAASNSVELYGRAELASRLNPVASVYYDIGKVRGAYLEGEISHIAASDARASLTLGALAGVSAGQGAEPDLEGEPQADAYNFEGDGFTHADLWATADITLGSLSVSPTLHLILTGDGATKASRMELEPGTGMPRFNRTGTKLWFGVSIGWMR